MFQTMNKNYTQWTQEEADLFQAEISLEKFALKKSSNNEVSMHIQQEFMNALQLDSLIKTNEKKIKITLFPDILNWTTALGN